MYKANPLFKQPNDEEIKVWRYIDFTKFVSLINSQSLFFSWADKFTDPFEGSYPKNNITNRRLPAEIPQEKIDFFLEEYGNESKLFELIKSQMAISCWHMNDNESAAMWERYSNRGQSVAIQSTYERLKESFKPEERDIHLGIVKYINYETSSFSSGDPIEPFVHKRESFTDEKEVRAIIYVPEFSVIPGHPIDTFFGLNVNANLEKLIECIYLAPKTPAWLQLLVREVIKKYDFSFKVVHSELDKDPFF